MKATEAKLLDFLKKSPQFIIPIYQRTYSWTEKECRQLWDDIIRAGSSDKVSVHFVGSIVYVESGLGNVTHQSPLLVIDGQQRLTTVTLLLAALAGAVFDTEPLDGFSRRKIRNYYLLNPEEEGERRFKLLLSQTDKTTLMALVGQDELPKEHSRRIKANYESFVQWMEDLVMGSDEDGDNGTYGNLSTLCKGLSKLVVVDIALNRDQDNAQLIFESMNSTGKELSQADLIRNYILMGLEPDLQTSLYEQFWRPMEVEFGQDAYGTHFDRFMRDYLTLKTGEIPRISEVYDAFKAYAQLSDQTTEELVRDIRDNARYFCAMALGAEPTSDLKSLFIDLKELKVDVSFPFLLELYRDYQKAILSKADFIAAIRLVEAYVFRRAICSIPTNSLNKTFATFNKALKKDQYLESIKAYLLSLPSYRRFPSDEEFQRDFQTRDLYNIRNRSYWLRRLENHGRKERVDVDDLTIEHILPQNENLSEAWQKDLGSDWKRVQETWLHTLGNLTLTAYNSEYSDRSFLEKREMPNAPIKGLKQSPLKLNQGIGILDTWNEEAIKARASKLSDLAIEVWSSPSLSQDILDTYKSKKESTHEYALSHYPDLNTITIGLLFEGFRKAIKDLNPCVTEEFLKQYIAYKAETNFVDVIPQSKKLRLLLNMKFGDIIDPKGICKDVTGVGHWGNGDVEIGISSMEEMPYVIGLVRQSLDQQLGNGD
jgi:uncharacterized protein with ParB-like and HNH nuclease domain/predicted transport protein